MTKKKVGFRGSKTNKVASLSDNFIEDKVDLKDNWQHRSKELLCETCMFFCNMRCRKRSPTMKGFPAVYPTDWCGDHKLEKEWMKEHSKL